MRVSHKLMITVVMVIVFGLVGFVIDNHIVHSSPQPTTSVPVTVKSTRSLGADVQLVSTNGVIYTDGGYLPQPTTGTWLKCAWKHWYTVVFQHCAILIQPATTKKFWTDHRDLSAAQWTALASQLIVLCGVLGPEMQAMCGAFMTLQGAYTFLAFSSAAKTGRCVRFQWDTFPTISLPLNMKVDAYGAAEKWLSAHINYSWGTEYGMVWGDPTRCGVRNTPKCPIPPAMDFLNTCAHII